MLFIYDIKNKILSASEETDFKSHEIMERKDIEKWVMKSPEIMGEDFFIITSEYDKFDKTKERLDLLAIDKKGKLAIIELKRDEGGKNVELQAIKYAAYCSTLTLDELINLRKEFISDGKSNDEIKKEVFDFIENDDFEELDDKPRIILVAKDFRPEVTASVLWLRKYGVEISCVKLTPHMIADDKIGIVSSILIPLPEAEEYIVKSERKEGFEKSHTRSHEEYKTFFTELVQEIKNKIPIALPEPSYASVYQIPTGLGGGVHFEWWFRKRPKSTFGVELHFEKGNREFNHKLIKEAEKVKGEIEKETGEKVIVQEEWGTTWSRMYMQNNEVEISEDLKKWAIDKMLIFYKHLQPKLDKMK